MNGKAEIIKEVYETNFGTAYGTYKLVVKEHTNIRLSDVKEYLDSRQDVQVKVKPKGQDYQSIYDTPYEILIF